MYYNLPSASGITLDAERLAELKRVAGVSTLKDTGGDAIAATAWFQAADGLPTLLNGYDTLTFAALAAGVRGVVWGAASFIPGPCVELHRLLIEEVNLVAARELWARIWPICDLLEATDYAAAVKAGCRHLGLATGPGGRHCTTCPAQRRNGWLASSTSSRTASPSATGVVPFPP